VSGIRELGAPPPAGASPRYLQSWAALAGTARRDLLRPRSPAQGSAGSRERRIVGPRYGGALVSAGVLRRDALASRRCSDTQSTE